MESREELVVEPKPIEIDNNIQNQSWQNFNPSFTNELI